MRFSLFVHMERWNDEVPHQEAWDNLVELTQIAEAGGFSTVWIGEHHSMEFTVSPSPFPQLAYLAAKTDTIRLGAGTVIAPFWHPVRAAGETALLDVISKGRAEIGVARGAYQFEFDRLANGLSARDGGSYLRELVPAMEKLWAGDYAHDGEHWQFPTSTAVPNPVQAGGPRVWIAARDPNTHDWAVEHGYNIMVTPLSKDDNEVVDLMNKVNTAVENHPEVEGRPEVMVLRHTIVHPADEPDGWVPGAVAINRYYRTFGAWASNKQTPERGFLEPLPEEDFADKPEYSLESLHKSAIIGTPAEVIERVCSYEALGYTEFGFWIDNSMTHEEKKASLELFVKEVVPTFQ